MHFDIDSRRYVSRPAAGLGAPVTARARQAANRARFHAHMRFIAAYATDGRGRLCRQVYPPGFVTRHVNPDPEYSRNFVKLISLVTQATTSQKAAAEQLAQKNTSFEQPEFRMDTSHQLRKCVACFFFVCHCDVTRDIKAVVRIWRSARAAQRAVRE